MVSRRADSAACRDMYVTTRTARAPNSPAAQPAMFNIQGEPRGQSPMCPPPRPWPPHASRLILWGVLLRLYTVYRVR